MHFLPNINHKEVIYFVHGDHLSFQQVVVGENLISSLIRGQRLEKAVAYLLELANDFFLKKQTYQTLPFDIH